MKHAIERGTVRREDLFLATKISDESRAGYDGVKRLVEEQLKLLQTSYIDLYMLHSPISDRQKQVSVGLCRRVLTSCIMTSLWSKIKIAERVGMCLFAS